MKKYRILCLLLCAVCAMPAAAGESVDLSFTSNIDEEIATIRVKYETPDDEPRLNTSNVYLPAGTERWHLGVQGATRPEEIIFELATKSYFFDDLSSLDPTDDMYLSLHFEGGVPILCSLGSDGDAGEHAVAVGEEHLYLTGDNRAIAVDRSALTDDVTTWEELGELIGKTIKAAGDDVPELVQAAVYPEDDDWGERAYLPVAWEDWIGVARVQQLDDSDEDDGLVVNMRFEIPEDGAKEMLEDLQVDLSADGFRPWVFAMETWDEDAGEMAEVELAFSEDGEGNKYRHQIEIDEKLFPAYEDDSLVKATARWVKEDAFDAIRAGDDPGLAQGIMVVFSKGIFEAAFIPDARLIAY